MAGIITLLTDFGLQDTFVGVMKGVIWGIAPQVKIVDLSHAVEPQNILQGALLLGWSVAYFPAESIHLAVVDPGVGTQRRPVAARLGEQYFVGPDNGLMTCLVEAARGRGQAVEVVHLNRPQYWLPSPSRSFHGRDIFAPAAAALANGATLAALGDFIEDYALLSIPKPEPVENGWGGIVLHVDRFGNLATNLQTAHLAGREDITLKIGSTILRGLSSSYGAGEAGKLVLLLNSAGCLEIAEVNGSAARRLGAARGEPVRLTFGVPPGAGKGVL